jgi:hypothetical protein
VGTGSREENASDEKLEPGSDANQNLASGNIMPIRIDSKRV